MVRLRPSGLFLAGVLLGCGAARAVSPVPADPDPTFLGQAVDAFVGDASSRAGDEDLWTLAAAPLIDFRAHPAALGRLWVQEAALSAGGGNLWRRAREEAASGGEKPKDALARLVTDFARNDAHLLLRAAARLFLALEPEASPSRLKLADVEAGALDAAPPPALSVRHRSILPDGETDSLVLAWPPDGADAAAVVRYVDRALPPDVVFFAGGDRRTIPLSGVARVDFVIAGSDQGVAGLRAPVDCVRDASAPFSRLEARATSGSGGPRLTWTTASHDGIWGWAVFREEVLADGRVARTGPELVPSSERARDSFGYAFVDTAAAPDTFYRYTVWAVTDEGVLAKAFSATLDTGRLRRD